MNSETRHNWSKRYALKKRISLILKSPRIAFWRVCGKDIQSMFITFLKNESEVEGYEAILKDVVLTYERALTQMTHVMPRREQKTKLRNLHNYAEGRF